MIGHGFMGAAHSVGWRQAPAVSAAAMKWGWVESAPGALAFDLEDLNAVHFYDNTAPEGMRGFTKILVTDPSHPYVGAWWPAGHMRGYEHGFVHQAKDLVEGIVAGTDPHPTFRDGLQVQRVLAAVESSATHNSGWVHIDPPATEGP